MSTALTALRLTLPRGLAWALGGHALPLVRGIAKALERLRLASDTIISESRPGTASLLTLPEWHALTGQRYDPTRPEPVQRARLEAFLSSAGGATITLLQAQIDLEFTGLVVSEASATSECGVAETGVAFTNGIAADVSPVYYTVTGTVNTEDDAQRVGQILEHFAPAHMVPLLLINVLSMTTIAECGVAISGLSITGSDGL